MSLLQLLLLHSFSSIQQHLIAQSADKHRLGTHVHRQIRKPTKKHTHLFNVALKWATVVVASPLHHQHQQPRILSSLAMCTDDQPSLLHLQRTLYNCIATTFVKSCHGPPSPHTTPSPPTTMGNRFSPSRLSIFVRFCFQINCL